MTRRKEQVINEWISKDIVENICFSIVLIMILESGRRIINKYLRLHSGEQKYKYNKRKGINGVFIILDLLGLMIIWYDRSNYIVTFIGVFSAGLAIAMKDIIINIVAGMYIIGARIFQIGERIEINGQIGDVIDLGFFQFTLLEVGNKTGGEQSTGRIVQVPNMQILYSPIKNYEKGFKYIWHEMKIQLEQQSDWERARDIINTLLEESTYEIVEEARIQIEELGKKYLIYYNYLTPIVYVNFENGKIILIARFLCEPRKIRTFENSIWERLLIQLKDEQHIHLC